MRVLKLYLPLKGASGPLYLCTIQGERRSKPREGEDEPLHEK